jgi:hypothetical protein
MPQVEFGMVGLRPSAFPLHYDIEAFAQQALPLKSSLFSMRVVRGHRHQSHAMKVQALLYLGIAASVCLPAYAQQEQSPAGTLDWNLWSTPATRSVRNLSWAERDLRTETKWSISDLIDNQRCSTPLRATLFTEIFQHRSISEQ